MAIFIESSFLSCQISLLYLTLPKKKSMPPYKKRAEQKARTRFMLALAQATGRYPQCSIVVVPLVASHTAVYSYSYHNG
jgi:hypothetical protein